jgi:glycosyltransferase involved in cell wall biosynthesis
MSARRVLVASEPMEYGVLSYLEHLFDGLDRSRWEPTLVFSPRRMAPQATGLVARLAARGIRVRSLPFRRGAGAGDAHAALHLLREVRALRPAVMHLHSTKAGLIGRIIARLAGVPVLYTPHGTSWHYTGRLVGRCQLGLERAFRGTTHTLLSVCAEEASAFVREVGFAPARVRVVPNGVRVPERAALAAARQSARRALDIPGDAVWLVFVGRLTNEKGLDVLLDALAHDVGADGLLVVGDGRERARLETAAAASRIPVRFCGYQTDVSPFLAAADVLVQPSRSEGLPFTLLEAMAHGLPVVCSGVGGMRAALGDCGRIVFADRPAELAECLRDLVHDKGARRTLGEAARLRAAAEFGLGPMLDAIHEAYDDAHRNGGQAAGSAPARAA